MEASTWFVPDLRLACRQITSVTVEESLMWEEGG